MQLPFLQRASTNQKQKIPRHHAGKHGPAMLDLENAAGWQGVDCGPRVRHRTRCLKSEMANDAVSQSSHHLSEVQAASTQKVHFGKWTQTGIFLMQFLLDIHNVNTIAKNNDIWHKVSIFALQKYE